MTIHRFTPVNYYRAIGTYEPALHVVPGDTVFTTCVDAVGQDATRAQVTPRGNPMTGPFFITGAEPGDTLVVRFDTIVPNRTYGWSGRSICTTRRTPWCARSPSNGCPRYADEKESQHEGNTNSPDRRGGCPPLR